MKVWVIEMISNLEGGMLTLDYGIKKFSSSRLTVKLVENAEAIITIQPRVLVCSLYI